MAYFVTGGTGFIGQHLIDRLLERKGMVYVLVRPQSVEKFSAVKARWGRKAKRVIAIKGDLAEPNLGVSAADRKRLKGKIQQGMLFLSEIVPP